MNNKTFEIGLVGAGAISAGAYTGGVIDFLIQALDQWYDAKTQDNQAPPHDVKLSVFSGASAGAISAALAAGYLGSDQPSITNEEEGRSNNGQNRLFDSWVDRIDIASLLESRDLDDENSDVVSLLDSSVLPEIADSGLTVTPRKTRRPYVSENFELILTVTNLRGVPYAFELLGDQPVSYDMSLHADYVHFRVNDTGVDQMADRYTMSWQDFGISTPVKEKLKISAIASGAFPMGLAPRSLNHIIVTGDQNTDWYSSREWLIPTPHSVPHQCMTPKSIRANWGMLTPNYEYNFHCVDGGVMNNEPLELARRILAGSAARNERNGELADKALLLIDPFPNNTSFDTEYKIAPDLFNVARSLFGALKNQARFKPDELVLAADNDVYSRFMIAPSRDGQTYPIACGSLDGFGGFLKREFRSHDYFLGRRNTQKFLQDHFVLPENNPLFNDWNKDLKEVYCVRDTNGQPKLKDGQRLLPIIPLVGKAKVPCYLAPWPEYTSDDLAQLIERIESRVDIVLDRLVDQYFKKNNPIVRFVTKLVLGRKKKDVVEFVEEKVTTDLTKMQLMR